MTAQQSNPLDRNPNQLPMTRVATYERCIDATIDRVWENVLDWEHLPWLHDSSFDYVSLDTAGEWGWRTWSNPEQTEHVELCVNRDESEYVARSYRQGEQVSEIWTCLAPNGDKTDITVSFDLPNIPAKKKDKLGDIFLGLYTRLWDEDEAMMQQRQKRLNLRYERSNDRAGKNQLTLDKPLNTPLTVTVGRSEWTIRELDDQLIVHSAICPHLLGPLDQSAKTDGRSVQCPWHGYRFDMVSGECLTDSAAPCKLKTPPKLEETANQITLTLLTQ